MNEKKDISLTPKHAYSQVPNKHTPSRLSILPPDNIWTPCASRLVETFWLMDTY